MDFRCVHFLFVLTVTLKKTPFQPFSLCSFMKLQRHMQSNENHVIVIHRWALTKQLGAIYVKFFLTITVLTVTNVTVRTKRYGKDHVKGLTCNVKTLSS